MEGRGGGNGGGGRRKGKEEENEEEEKESVRYSPAVSEVHAAVSKNIIKYKRTMNKRFRVALFVTVGRRGCASVLTKQKPTKQMKIFSGTCARTVDAVV